MVLSVALMAHTSSWNVFVSTRCLRQQLCPSLSVAFHWLVQVSQTDQQMGKDKHEPPRGPLTFLPEKAKVERRQDLFDGVQVTPRWSPCFYLECKSLWK